MTSTALAIRKKGRPEKPDDLKVTYDGDPLTAHHLFPYNRIESDLSKAIEEQDLRTVSNFMAFKGETSTDESDAFRLLAYQRPHKPSKAWKKHQRNAKEEGINGEEDSSDIRLRKFFREAAWARHNIFMGPAPELRADDPHERYDTHVVKGKETESSKLAKEMFDSGVGALENADFHEKLKKARKDPESREFHKKDWEETEIEGKKKYRHRS